MPSMNFPYSNPLLAMTGGMGMNPLLMNPTLAASFASAHHNPQATLSSLAAATASAAIGTSAGSASSGGSLRGPSPKTPRLQSNPSATSTPFPKKVRFFPYPLIFIESFTLLVQVGCFVFSVVLISFDYYPTSHHYYWHLPSFYNK